MVILILHIMYSQWSSLGFYCGMVGWTPAAPLSHVTKYILIKSSYLEHGTIGMDACCVPDVILQSLHLISNSSRAVNIDVDMFEACQILQTKDQATFPLELEPCNQDQFEPFELWHGSRLKLQCRVTPITAEMKLEQTLKSLWVDCVPWVDDA